MIDDDTDPDTRATELNLIQIVDVDALKKIVEVVVSENQTEWTNYKSGSDKLLMFFVGKCMKASNGSGNPAVFTEIIKSL